MIQKIILPVLLIGLVLSLAGQRPAQNPVQAQTPAQPESATGLKNKSLVPAGRHMVVAAHPLAVEAGRDMLRKGGSATDAAIATQLVLNLVEPQSSGIGGGAFLLHWNAKARKLRSYDGRETAPLAATPDRFLQDDGLPMHFLSARTSGRAVGVPGLLRMLEMAHKAHGRLPWADLFAPAIRLAEQGFPVGERLNRLLTRAGTGSFNSAGKHYFFDAAGHPWPQGHMLKNPAFARTLQLISENGASAFYEGQIPQDIVSALSFAPASLPDMTLRDFSVYQARERSPVCAPYRAIIVCGMGPPSSGGLSVAQILMLLEASDLGREPLNTKALHKIAEAEKLTYADRARYMADNDFVPVPDGLLDPAYIRARQKLIGPDPMGKARHGIPPGLDDAARGRDATKERPGTSHVSIIDAYGNALSMTTTIESGFGTGIMVDGFLLNNELTDFSFRPKDQQGNWVANRVEPGKRPRSSMAPTIAFDGRGRVKAVLGSPGGSRIILYVVKSLIALVDWNMNAQQAVALINFGSRNRGAFELEAHADAASLAPDLQLMGHLVKLSPMTSGTHIIVVRPNGLEGGADPRREGIALGD